MMSTTPTDRRATDSLRCSGSARDGTGAQLFVFVLKDGTEERIEGADVEDALAKFYCARLISCYWALEKIEEIFRQDDLPTGTATGGDDDLGKFDSQESGCGTAAASSPPQSAKLSDSPGSAASPILEIL